MIRHNHKDDRETNEDFILEVQPSSFRSPYKKKNAVLAASGCCYACCCCCWHIVGAYVGAYIGGVVGSGLAYRRIRKKNEKLIKYRWLLLWNFLITVAISFNNWNLINNPSATTGTLFHLFSELGLDIFGQYESYIIWLLALWVVLISPCICFIAIKKFSWRILWMSLLFSIVAAAIGFGIGYAVLES